MKNVLLVLVAFFLYLFPGAAQHKSHPQKSFTASKKYKVGELKPVKPFYTPMAGIATPLAKEKILYRSLSGFVSPVKNKIELTVMERSSDGLPLFIKGQIPGNSRTNMLTNETLLYLEAAGKLMQIDSPKQEFRLKEQFTDDYQHTHMRMDQYYQGLPVFGGEIILHASGGKIHSLNGRHYPTPELEDVVPIVVEHQAIERAKENLKSFRSYNRTEKRLTSVPQVRASLVIFHPDMNPEAERLVWQVIVYPSLISKWVYFIDAKNGAVLQKYADVCRIDGTIEPNEAHQHECAIDRAGHSLKKHNTLNSESPPGGPVSIIVPDLFGTNRELNVWENNGTLHMIDASKTMYDPARSNLPDVGKGVIATLDAGNKSPSILGGYSASDVTSTRENWTSLAVSAQYNAVIAFEFFQNTFGRNSVDGQGGNMLSLINVVDEAGENMDNAFYLDGNMYYGNGDVAFEPLAKALDVAIHETTHGVIAKTANLVYLNQSGALNESIADVFGALVDTDDWTMGEDVVRTSVFPSGALRDMANPNNGAQKLQRGWQPAHMDEFANLRDDQDNGGVHINSGIPNRAFFLFASAIGRDKAGQIYYRALRDYLTRSSQFIDLRLAVIQSATDLHGAGSNEVLAAANAFDAVGILGDSPGGGENGSNYQEDLEINPGQDYILLTDADNAQVYLYDGATAPVISTTKPLSKLSITDDGVFAVFIAEDLTMKVIEFDWSGPSPTFQEYTIQDQPIWRNVAISKDGLRLGAITDDRANSIYIYDFVKEIWETFDLYNPTTAEGITSGNVLYADALEWDYNGEFLLYDAFNQIPKENGTDLEYWDVGFLRAWNEEDQDFGDGLIIKLISDLPENTSIGNASFSKNSPYIIAFDFIDDNNDYFVMGANIETGDVGVIFESNTLGFPNYSRLDDQLLFDFRNNGERQVLAIVDLEEDKITGVASSGAILVDLGKWGVWFAPGVREFETTAVEEQNPLAHAVEVYPNPFSGEISIKLNDFKEEVSLSILNLLGEELLQNKIGQQQFLNLGHLTPGNYLLRLTSGVHTLSKKLVKIK